MLVGKVTPNHRSKINHMAKVVKTANDSNGNFLKFNTYPARPTERNEAIIKPNAYVHNTKSTKMPIKVNAPFKCNGSTSSFLCSSIPSLKERYENIDNAILKIIVSQPKIVGKNPGPIFCNEPNARLFDPIKARIPSIANKSAVINRARNVILLII